MTNWADALLAWIGMTDVQADGWERWVAILLLVVLAYIADFVLRFVVVRGVGRIVEHTNVAWDNEIFSRSVLARGCHIVSAVLLLALLPVVLVSGDESHDLVMRFANAYFILSVVRFLTALLRGIFHTIAMLPAWQNKPINGLRQTAQGIVIIIGTILMVSVLINRSPMILLTGLGASAAVMMLIFRDSILGFVSGIQLSANDMLQVGDWITMSKYGADGVVEEVSLTTVKVRNFDKTIITLPPYLLVSESFQNWRGMQQSGGRRIMRSVSIDMTSVKFCDAAMLARLRKIDLVSDYIDLVEQRMEGYNEENGYAGDPLAINGKHQTNLGIFRAYLERYIANEVPINKDMMVMVRQLQPTETGVPLQLYLFTNTVVWTEYERIQADLFDHVLAAIPQFGLRVFQNPSGNDLTAVRDAVDSAISGANE